MPGHNREDQFPTYHYRIESPSFELYLCGKGDPRNWPTVDEMAEQMSYLISAFFGRYIELEVVERQRENNSTEEE